jgi:6-phosphofructokinase 1
MPAGKNLKGRYIVRVGWDDVRGWMSEVLPLDLSLSS